MSTVCEWCGFAPHEVVGDICSEAPPSSDGTHNFEDLP